MDEQRILHLIKIEIEEKLRIEINNDSYPGRKRFRVDLKYNDRVIDQDWYDDKRQQTSVEKLEITKQDLPKQSIGE